MAIMVSGTDRNMPASPQMLPHTASEISTTSGEMLSEVPISFGSTMLPMTNWVAPPPINTARTGAGEANCTTASRVGNRMPSSEPMVGM